LKNIKRQIKKESKEILEEGKVKKRMGRILPTVLI